MVKSEKAETVYYNTRLYYFHFDSCIRVRTKRKRTQRQQQHEYAQEYISNAAFRHNLLFKYSQRRDGGKSAVLTTKVARNNTFGRYGDCWARTLNMRVTFE